MRNIVALCLLLAAAEVAALPDAERPPGAEAIRLAPAPRAAATRQGMHRWHRAYRSRVSPVLREWAAVARVARERPGDSLLAGCRRLDLALDRLRRGRMPVAPDPSVSLHLEQTLRTLAEATDSCAQGAWFLTTWRLREADDSWRQLRSRLLLYGLAP